MRVRTFAALVFAGALFAGGASEAKSVSAQKVQLQPTSADPDAAGRATVRVRGAADGRFELQVRRLERQATYEVLVDGVKVGEITTSNGGSGRIRFRSRPRGHRDEFLGFDPRGALVAVRDAAGEDVLAGTLALQSGREDKVICCVPDDDGPECEDRRPDDCVARGGTVSSATSCLPNPCEGSTPPGDPDVVCCIPDDSGPECEDRTSAECASQGGIVVEATSCTDNPCAGTPSSDPDIQCCVPRYYVTECEDRTPAECAAEGGVDVGPGACVPDACAGIVPPDDHKVASVRIRCEQRSDRSKISIDGSGLAAGNYTAVAISGGNQAVSGVIAAVLGEAEFDFDSDGGDVGAGATPIAADFLQGSVSGRILDAAGDVVVEGSAICDVR